MIEDNKRYIAIIGDMKNSKEIINRENVQRQFHAVLEDINNTFAGSIASNFTITLGDEFQGLLSDFKVIMEIISIIERRMYPYQFRFAVGIGDITTKINPYLSIGADGPAYHHARKGIEFLKSNEKRNQTYTADIRFEASQNEIDTIAMINTILSLMSVVKGTWTNRQQEIIWAMFEHQESQLKVAERLGITQPTVQKSLAKGNYYAYKEAYDTLNQVLDH